MSCEHKIICQFSLSRSGCGITGPSTDAITTRSFPVTYSARIEELNKTIAANGAPWGAIDAESAACMVVQNRFRTGLDIARYTAKIMREDMDAYDRDPVVRHSVAWHLVRLHRAAEDDLDHSYRQHLRRYLTRRAGWSPRCAANSACSPTNRCTRRFGPGADRGTLHLPQPGRCPRTGRPVPRTGCRQGSHRRGEHAAPIKKSTSTKRMSFRSSPISMPASAMPRRLTCSPRR